MLIIEKKIYCFYQFKHKEHNENCFVKKLIDWSIDRLIDNELLIFQFTLSNSKL